MPLVAIGGSIDWNWMKHGSMVGTLSSQDPRFLSNLLVPSTIEWACRNWFKAAISACANGEQWQCALSFFEDFEFNGLDPWCNRDLYIHIIYTYLYICTCIYHICHICNDCICLLGIYVFFCCMCIFKYICVYLVPIHYIHCSKLCVCSLSFFKRRLLHDV